MTCTQLSFNWPVGYIPLGAEAAPGARRDTRKNPAKIFEVIEHRGRNDLVYFRPVRGHAAKGDADLGRSDSVEFGGWPIPLSPNLTV